MNKDVSQKTVYKYIQNLLAYNCMPTLLKMKPSTILNIQKQAVEKADLFFCQLEQEIAQFDCQYNVVLETKTSYMILVYQEHLLRSQLEDKECQKILRTFGYQFDQDIIQDALSCLQERYRTYMEDRMEFPDELGIFFGYPVEDVKAYIANNGRNYKCCGFWKVYCNVECAERTFCAFRQAREAAVQALSAGMSLIEVERNYQFA